MAVILDFFEKQATWKNTLMAAALLALNVILLDALDRPLERLAGGEPKLDLRFGYDLAVAERLFRAYGEQGRTIYAWNLLVDTTFPILLALTITLLVFVAFKDRRLRAVLSLAPAVFMVTDLLENLVLFSFLQSYPSLSPALVQAASLLTQVKRSAFYLSLGVVALCLAAAGFRLARARLGRAPA